MLFALLVNPTCFAGFLQAKMLSACHFKPQKFAMSDETLGPSPRREGVEQLANAGPNQNSGTTVQGSGANEHRQKSNNYCSIFCEFIKKWGKKSGAGLSG